MAAGTTTSPPWRVAPAPRPPSRWLVEGSTMEAAGPRGQGQPEKARPRLRHLGGLPRPHDPPRQEADDHRHDGPQRKGRSMFIAPPPPRAAEEDHLGEARRREGPRSPRPRRARPMPRGGARQRVALGTIAGPQHRAASGPELGLSKWNSARRTMAGTRSSRAARRECWKASRSVGAKMEAGDHRLRGPPATQRLHAAGRLAGGALVPRGPAGARSTLAGR